MDILTKWRGGDESAYTVFVEFYSKFEQKIRKLLLNLGFSPKLDGYNYICYAIPLILTEREYLKNLTTGLYPIIADMFSVKAHCVERSIRHALDAAEACGKMNNLNKLLGVEVYGENIKITNAELLSLISEVIMLGNTLEDACSR